MQTSTFWRYFKFLYSFWVILPVVFFYAFACGIATFIENDYGSVAARAMIYNAWWFDILHMYLALALLASFIKSNAWQRKKYASLVLHFSFVVIIIGAGITRFFGNEGNMSIPEGQSVNYYYTSENYLNITGLNEQWQKDYASIKADITTYGTLFSKPKLKAKTTLFDKPLIVESTDISILDTHAKSKNPQMVLKLKITYNDETKEVQLIGGDGNSYEFNPLRVEIGGLKMALHWGSKKAKLPFSIRLLEFELKTYAGSESPSSYASEVEVVDNEGKILFPFRIFMNNVLDFEGYRFYQSQYYGNQDGSMTTVLSVNKDPGKIPTYIGYALLIIGALLVLFDKKGRFMSLAQFLRSQQIAVFLFGVFVFVGMTSDLYAESKVESIDMHGKESSQVVQTDPHASALKREVKIPIDEINARINLLKDHSQEFAKRFARIQIQNIEGRIEPLDTMAMNIVHKIYKKDGYKGLSNIQVLMGFMIFPNDWATIKIISSETPKLRSILGVNTNEANLSWLDVYNLSQNTSKLQNYVADITAHIPQSEYGTFEKDVLRVNESYEIIKSVQNLLYFRVFPDIKTKRWFSITELMQLQANGQIPQEEYKRLMEQIAPITDMLLFGIQKGVMENSWKDALLGLKALEVYQEQNGGSDYISENRISWEIWLNHYNIFEVLQIPYLILGILSFILVLVFILKDKPMPKALHKGLYYLIALCVLVHTFGLGVRWYVADHSPWSNSYESMLYIAWAAGIAGVVFFRKYLLALCAASFLAGISLIVAHIGFMNPQISNLVPVLKSYWLNIHVSVITASYGFLGLCFMLGVFGLILFILRSQRRPHIDKAIYSIVAINEMSMILGLLMLTIGNFLGGIWANESWGRYWGWDPKETWALISIGIYAIVLHLRFMGFKNMPFIFSAASVVAFYSILMTYYGVNYYLSGMHSYAAGDPLPIPWYLYVFVLGTIALIIIASFKKQLSKLI